MVTVEQLRDKIAGGQLGALKIIRDGVGRVTRPPLDSHSGEYDGTGLRPMYRQTRAVQLRLMSSI